MDLACHSAKLVRPYNSCPQVVEGWVMHPCPCESGAGNLGNEGRRTWRAIAGATGAAASTDAQQSCAFAAQPGKIMAVPLSCLLMPGDGGVQQDLKIILVPVEL